MEEGDGKGKEEFTVLVGVGFFALENMSMCDIRSGSIFSSQPRVVELGGLMRKATWCLHYCLIKVRDDTSTSS
jgi:hypothetical protein